MLNILIPIVFIIFSVVMLIAAQDIPGSTKWDVVGSRMVPQALIIAMLILSVILLLMAIRNYLKTPKENKGGNGFREWFHQYHTILLVFVLLLLWILNFNTIGFFCGAVILMAIIQWWLEGRVFAIRQILVPAAAALCCYLVFNKLLLVMFPAGIWDRLF